MAYCELLSIITQAQLNLVRFSAVLNAIISAALALPLYAVALGFPQAVGRLFARIIQEEHMNRFRNALLAAAAAMLIVQALLFTSPGQALAQNVASVLVANTAANPVPVRDVNNGQQPVILSGTFAIAAGQNFASRVLRTSHKANSWCI
jgi:hypothetical protein